MAYFLLDSDAVIDYLFGIPASVALIADLGERGNALCLSDVVVAEVFAGLSPAEQERAGGFIEACRFFETSYAAARQAGQWRYGLARQGQAISSTDALIAATAREHDATIVTGNVRDYPMSDVALEPLPR